MNDKLLKLAEEIFEAGQTFYVSDGDATGIYEVQFANLIKENLLEAYKMGKEESSLTS